MTKAAKNGQAKTQTVHVALPKPTLHQIRLMAQVNRRSMSAQVAWLVEQALRLGFPPQST